MFTRYQMMWIGTIWTALVTREMKDLRISKLMHPAKASVRCTLVIECFERFNARKHFLWQVEIVILVRWPKPSRQHLR